MLPLHPVPQPHFHLRAQARRRPLPPVARVLACCWALVLAAQLLTPVLAPKPGLSQLPFCGEASWLPHSPLGHSSWHR